MNHEDKDEAEIDKSTEIPAAKSKPALFQNREDYRQKRLEKILNEKDKPESPTFEEI